LRYELRRLREQRGLTIEQVQEQSGGDLRAPTISRWETGDRSIRPTDLRLLLDIYDVHGEQREALLTLARQAKERGWWQSYGSAVPEWFQVYVGLEAEASSVHVYESELVPGLLQTAEYYRAFLRTAPAAGNDDEIERKIAVRLTRQERLTGDSPPEYRAVLNEAAIRRVVGGGEAMREQLNHIADIAKLPHVSIQVLPFGAGIHPAMDGAFRILGFPEPGDPDVVYLESQISRPRRYDHNRDRLPEADPPRGARRRYRHGPHLSRGREALVTHLVAQGPHPRFQMRPFGLAGLLR